MSNQKLRHWIYLAIGFLILASTAWWFLAHPSKLTDDYVKNEIFTVHRQAFDGVSDYLKKKDIIADITAIPTVDNPFGIPNEDSDACRAYNDGITELMHTEIAEVAYTGTAVQFTTNPSGGFLPVLLTPHGLTVLFKNCYKE